MSAVSLSFPCSDQLGSSSWGDAFGDPQPHRGSYHVDTAVCLDIPFGFIDHARTPSPSFQNALARMLQSASSTNLSLSARVLIGPGLTTIPKQLLDKIQRWEFVEIAELLPSSNAEDATLPSSSSPARFSLFPGCEVIRVKMKQPLPNGFKDLQYTQQRSFQNTLW